MKNKIIISFLMGAILALAIILLENNYGVPLIDAIILIAGLYLVVVVLLFIIYLSDSEIPTYRVVRWHNNEHDDIVCADSKTAKKHVKRHNALAGSDECYVDEEVFLLLTDEK